MSDINNTNKLEFINKEELVDCYYKEYPLKHYLTYPEYTINKLSLSKELLNGLNEDVNKRTREDIKNWMIDNKKITYEDFIWVGW